MMLDLTAGVLQPGPSSGWLQHPCCEATSGCLQHPCCEATSSQEEWRSIAVFLGGILTELLAVQPMMATFWPKRSEVPTRLRTQIPSITKTRHKMQTNYLLAAGAFIAGTIFHHVARRRISRPAAKRKFQNTWKSIPSETHACNGVQRFSLTFCEDTKHVEPPCEDTGHFSLHHDDMEHFSLHRDDTEQVGLHRQNKEHFSLHHEDAEHFNLYREDTEHIGLRREDKEHYHLHREDTEHLGLPYEDTFDEDASMGQQENEDTNHDVFLQFGEQPRGQEHVQEKENWESCGSTEAGNSLFSSEEPSETDASTSQYSVSTQEEATFAPEPAATAAASVVPVSDEGMHWPNAARNTKRRSSIGDAPAIPLTKLAIQEGLVRMRTHDWDQKIAQVYEQTLVRTMSWPGPSKAVDQ